MKTHTVLVINALIIISALAGSIAAAEGIKSSAVQPANSPAISSEEELAAFVESAAAYAQSMGRDVAIRDFMNISGPWVRGETYIFAHDFNGTALVLPYLPDDVGTNRLDLQDAEGRYINRDMRAIAMNKSGFYHYVYRNPATNETEPKVSYVMKVDDTWWLGSGIYVEDENKKQSP